MHLCYGFYARVHRNRGIGHGWGGANLDNRGLSEGLQGVAADASQFDCIANRDSSMFTCKLDDLQ